MDAERIRHSTEPARIFYSQPQIIKHYTSVGFSPAEKAIYTRFFKRGDAVLNIGCGTGRESIALAKEGYIVTAFDIVPEMIAIAKQQARDHDVHVDFRVINALDMDFLPESFPFVFFSFNGIECILGRNNQEKVVRDVFTILKPGGYFILTSRSGAAFGRRWLAWCWMLLTHPWQKHKWGPYYVLGDKRFGEYHIHYSSPFHIRSLARKTGFCVEYFNSEKNIVSEKPANFLTNFSNDRMLFYVLKKPAAA